MTNQNTNNNKIVALAARQALEQMKLEVASELGFPNYDTMDKGNLTARQNGAVGGQMTKRLLEQGKRKMSSTTMGKADTRSNMTNNTNAKHGDR